MGKRIFAALLCAAVMSTTAVVPAYAEMHTAVVMNEYNASATIEWDGKSELEAGKKYKVSKDITISKKVTVPSKATLTVMKGAKLKVSTKGSLYIKGTVNVKKGGTLSVAGTMNLYSGKNLTTYGTVSFGTKSKITLSGKLTVKKGGTVKGEPKKLTLGKKLKLTVNGSCTTKALKELNDKNNGVSDNNGEYEYAGLDEYIVDYTRTLFVEGNFLKLFDEMLPKGVGNAFREEYAKSIAGVEDAMSFEEVFAMTGALFMSIIAEAVGGEIIDVKPEKIEIAAVDVSSLNMTDTVSDFYKNIDKAAKVTGNISVVGTQGTQPIGIDGIFVKMDGKWYSFVSSLDEVLG